MRRKRNILMAILLLLLILLGGLIYALLSFRQVGQPEVLDVTPGLKHIRSIYAYGQGSENLLQAPWGVAFSAGEIFVSDNQLGTVFVFSTDGEFIRKIGEKGELAQPAPGQLTQPLGVGLDGAGDVMVADSGGRVDIFERSGPFKASLEVQYPVVPYYQAGRIYVSTAGPIVLFDQETLQPLTFWGKRGRGVDDFDFANGLAVDDKGTAYVADSNNMRVKAVNGDGVEIWSIGKPPDSMSDTDRVFGLPGGLALVGDTLYVVDPLNSAIHLLSTKGDYLAEVGEFGQEEGYFSYPTQIAYLGSNRFAITEWGNARVQIVEIDRDAVIRDYQQRSKATVKGSGG